MRKYVIYMMFWVLVLVVVSLTGCGGGSGGSGGSGSGGVSDVVSYTVSYNSNGGSSVNSQTVASNSTASLPTAPTRAGFTFAGWYSDSGLNTSFNFNTPITGDTSLYAKWTNTTSSSVSDFYGRLTLNYKFYISSTTYTDIANFSSSNLSSDGKTVATFVVGDTGRAIACGLSPTYRSHLCLIVNSRNNVKEAFLFDLVNYQILNGLYAYCTASQSSASCAANLILTSDGTVWGSVSRLAKSLDESSTVGDDTSKSLLKLDSGETVAKSETLSSQQQQTAEELGVRLGELGNQLNMLK